MQRPCILLATPPVQDPDALAKGKALFQSGLLSEAALALEAEVQRSPANVEAWRLLGTVHAENDDDQQVRLEVLGVFSLCNSRLPCMQL
jgi:peroxin-5